MENNLELKDEYELWRKNCRFMYEFVSETALTWPSLTVQWLPQYSRDNGLSAKLLIGTHTSGQDTNFLKVALASLPSPRRSEIKKTPPVIKVSKKIESSYEINRARYMPQDPNLVGAINGDGSCEIFNLERGIRELSFKPHKENGYGLSWNTTRRGILLTASDDKTCVVSDINKFGSEESLIEKYDSHSQIVNDAKWHNFDTHLFGSVSDDENVFLFDTRTSKIPVNRLHNLGSKGVNTLAFSPFSQNLLAVGNQSSNIDFFDLRMISKGNSSKGLLHTMMGHGDGITSMEFCPHKDGYLVSGSQDRRVIIWDLSKIGEEQTQEDAEDGAPEIFMMHAGHTGAVTDVSWCPFENWTVASTADDNILHVWKISNSLVDPDSTATQCPILE